jgi:hypothetical protein
MIKASIQKSPRINWETQKAKLKLAFPKLTAEDLNFDEMHKAEMLQKLEPKLAMTTEELQLILETL